VIVERRGLRQISDSSDISAWVERVLAENPEQVEAYLAGKETIAKWFFGQVMRLARGQANPQVVQQELDRHLENRKIS
jgi:Asp-tRNA(Asn)/Glu-tRNA(Gln) amidotransferase B subunit